MELACDICGKKFTANRSDARYCSGRCRTIAYRRRTGQESAPRRRPPLRDVYQGAEYELDKTVRRLERIAEDDRWPKVSTQVAAPARLRRYRQRLSNLFVTRESPVTPENLAMPQPARRGPRREHLQILEASLASLGGVAMLLREEQFRTLDASVTPEDARKLAGEFNDAIDALSLIVAQLDKRAAEYRRWTAIAPESVEEERFAMTAAELSDTDFENLLERGRADGDMSRAHLLDVLAESDLNAERPAED